MAVTANVGPDDCVDHPMGRQCGPVYWTSVVAYILAGLTILTTLGLLAVRLLQRRRARS